MDKAEAVKVFDLVVKEHMLPATMDKLVPLSFIGAAAVKFYQAKVKLMDQLGATEAQRKATLEDGQDAGEMLLNIEARIGQLLPTEEEAQKVAEPGRQGGRRVLPDSFGSTTDARNKRARAARAVARNPSVVKAVIKEARENEDIPTKTAVLNKIRAERAERRLAEAQKRAAENLDKKAEKAVKQEPRGVGEYFDALKEFRERLELTIQGAKREHWFAPESINIVRDKHERIRALMIELEEIIA